MALKSRDWFYKQCIIEVDGSTQLSALSWDILKKGIGQLHGTRGHATQAIGATQGFLTHFPQHRVTIRNAQIAPFDLLGHPAVLADWLAWFGARTGAYGRRFGYYDYDTLRTYLTPPFGGVPFAPGAPHGGRGDDEFKTVLRLMPEFIGRP
jgi:hypothetical protein